MNKSLKYLLIAFGILLFLYFINQGQQNKYIGTSETIFDLDADIINKIILKDSSGESITLFKTDSVWSILDNDSLVVKDRQIDQFFEKVIGGTYDMVMSKNPNKWVTFGVDTVSGKLLSVFQDDKLIASTIFSNKLNTILIIILIIIITYPLLFYLSKLYKKYRTPTLKNK